MTWSGLRTWQIEAGPARAEWRLLLAAATILWVMIYAFLNLGLLTSHLEHQPERALRRIVTCAVGLLLCVAMIQPLHAFRSTPLLTRIRVVVVLALSANLLHLAVRLAVFHIYRPLWGPLEREVVLAAIQGSGLVFALWATVCLLFFAERRHRETLPRPSNTQPDAARTIWSEQGPWRVKVPLDEVILCQAERDYVRLHTMTRQFLVRGKLKDWVEILPRGRYLRVHRSAILELDAVKAIRSCGSAWRARLSNGLEVPVSRSMGRTVREILHRSITDRP